MISLTKVHFEVYAEVDITEDVFVTGGVWSLGSFDPVSSVQLYTTEESYPVWRTAKPVLISTGRTTGYKYLIRSYDSNLDEEFSWESKRGILRFLTPLGLEMTVKDKYGLIEADKAHIPSEIATSDTFSVGPDCLTSSPVSILNEESVRTTSKTPAETMESSPTISSNTIMNTLHTDKTKSFSEMHRNKILYLVSFHLPVRVYWHEGENPDLSDVDNVAISKNNFTGYWTVQWDVDNIISKTENSVSDEMNVVWVGALSRLYNFDRNFYELSTLEREGIRKLIERSLPCRVIILEENVYKLYYIYFCKQKLRNLFHHVLKFADYSDQILLTPDGWKAMNVAIEGFAEVILKNVKEWRKNGKEEAIIWVHDYHLLTLPMYLRENWEKKLSGNGDSSSAEQKFLLPMGLKIIFFCHIPFPTPEVFRTLSMKRELLGGALGADIIGFNTFDHARYFMNSVKRFLGFQYYSRKGGTIMIDVNDRPVLLFISHVSIEPEMLNSVLLSTQLKKLTDQICHSYVIKSISKLSHSNSISKANETAFLSRKLQEKLLNENKFTKKKVFAGIDEVQKLKGIVYKLLAFETFLRDCPNWRKDVVFIQHGIRRRANDQSVSTNDESSREIKVIVERINKTYGPVVVYKEHFYSTNSIDLHERLALYLNADVLVETPIMEGLNLIPLEFIYAKHMYSKLHENQDGENSTYYNSSGVVIISEFAACSSALNGAVRVNPFDTEYIAKMYDLALKMPYFEREKRKNRDIKFISSFPSASWSKNMIEELYTIDTTSSVTGLPVSLADSVIGESQNLSEQGRVDLVSANIVLQKFHSEPLNHLLVKQNYAKAKNRVILLDFGGTLSQRESSALFIKRDFLGVSKRKLSERQTNILTAIAKDPKNVVFIVSGNSTKVLDVVFSDLLQNKDLNLGLVGNTGLSIRWGNIKRLERKQLTERLQKINEEYASDNSATPDGRNADEWESVLPRLQEEWVSYMKSAGIEDILENYTWRTGGSYWSQTMVSTRWDFRQSDPEWGQIQATQIRQKLADKLHQFSQHIDIECWKNSVQITPKNVSKGTAVTSILQTLKAMKALDSTGYENVFDFGLCIGDDVEDELMFKSLFEEFEVGVSATDDSTDSESNSSVVNTPVCLYTVTVGVKPTEARFYVNNSDQVLNLLEELSLL